MQFPRIYIQENLPEGYSGSVKVLANLTSKELTTWYAANLGTPGCAECKEGRAEAGASLFYCPACTAARAAFGQSIVLIYGPTLLDADVSTPEKALAFFDNDDWQPAEIVAWLYTAPDAICIRRTDALKKMLRSPLATSEALS